MSSMIHQLLNPYNDRRTKLRNRPLYTYRVIIAAVAIVLVCAAIPALRNRDWFVALLAVVGGIAAFFFQQHANETTLFVQLFQAFNSRYNDMNERLQTIRKSEQPLTAADRLLIIDYFNLCAEEYLFYDAGYIDQRVWFAWVNGIRWYAEDQRFTEVWRTDGGADSYYGFTFPPPSAH